MSAPRDGGVFEFGVGFREHDDGRGRAAVARPPAVVQCKRCRLYRPAGLPDSEHGRHWKVDVKGRAYRAHCDGTEVEHAATPAERDARAELQQREGK